MIPWNRRECLTALLGAPLALSACRRSPVRHLTGSIVGGAATLGHRLRDPNALPRARTDGAADERVGTAIVGAGPSGLSAAWRLRRAGVTNVVAFDLEEAPGGTSRSGRNAVSAYPWGAHYLPVPLADNRALITLLREMNVVESLDPQGAPRVAEAHLVRDLDERVFAQGTWHDGLYLRHGASHADLAEWDRFRAEIDRWADWRDAQGRRAFGSPMATGSDDETVCALDHGSMAQWMDAHGFRSSRLRWLVAYACRDDYGLTMENTSAWAGVFYFASRLARSGAQAQELIAWPEGNGRLVRHLAETAAIRTGWLVSDVVSVPEGVRLAMVNGASGEMRVVHADRAIVATPQFIASRVVAARRERTDDPARAFTYAPWMVANLTLRDHPRTVGAEMAWDNVLYDSPSLGYVCATHQSMRDAGPTVLTYYYAFTGDPAADRRRLLATGWREWADAVMSDLAPAHPDLDALVDTLDVYRWGHGMVRPTVGFMFGPERARAAEPIHGRIFFAHCDLSGIALFEEAHHRGVLAAEDALRSMGVSFETMLG